MPEGLWDTFTHPWLLEHRLFSLQRVFAVEKTIITELKRMTKYGVFRICKSLRHLPTWHFAVVHTTLRFTFLWKCSTIRTLPTAANWQGLLFFAVFCVVFLSIQGSLGNKTHLKRRRNLNLLTGWAFLRFRKRLTSTFYLCLIYVRTAQLVSFIH